MVVVRVGLYFERCEVNVRTRQRDVSREPDLAAAVARIVRAIDAPHRSLSSPYVLLRIARSSLAFRANGFLSDVRVGQIVHRVVNWYLLAHIHSR